MGALTLTLYAQLLARLACRRGARVEDVLAELGVGADDLARDEQALRRELAAAWPSRKGIDAMKFATALGRELERLGALGGDGAPAEDRERDAASAPLPSETRPREPELPSFLQTPRAQITSFAPAPVAPPPIVHTRMEATTPSRSPLAGTADMDLSAIVAAVTRGATPFQASEGSSAPAPSAQTAPEADAGAPPEAGKAVPPARVTELTVAQYASLRVELQRRPDQAASILSRYQVPSESREELDASWRARFEADPLLRAEFARAYAAYLAWLGSNTGG
ncbi:Hypothetical protein A7982_01383 [Minicystis rosea]|nr:Hypothetical protein A7982_01383 [Minicystis rosea]